VLAVLRKEFRQLHSLSDRQVLVKGFFMRRRLEFGHSGPQDHLAITLHGRPIRWQEWTASARATAQEAAQANPERVRGHSPRLSGARWWNGVGASRETMAMVGDGKNLEVLER
jgi:hypothetical protein